MYIKIVVNVAEFKRYNKDSILNGFLCLEIPKYKPEI